MTVKDSVAMIGWPYFHVSAQIGHCRRRPTIHRGRCPSRSRRGDLCQDDHAGLRLLASGISSLHGITATHGARLEYRRIVSGRRRLGRCGCRIVSVGTDIAGSVRLPAAHCGLASLKPTHGRVPHLPADTMRMAGPMGRSVDDIARLLTVLARQDERDTWSLPADGVRYHESSAAMSRD